MENTNSLVGAEIHRRKSHRKIICRYCKKSIDREFTTTVPYLPNIQAKWIAILGERFAENLKKFHQVGSKDFGRICLRHFEGDLKRRKQKELPIRMSEKEENELRNDEKVIDESNPKKCYKCCYCEESLKQEFLTRIPYDRSVREKWIEILGTRFSENMKKVKHGYICRSHFDGNFKHRTKQQFPNGKNEDNCYFQEINDLLMNVPKNEDYEVEAIVKEDAEIMNIKNEEEFINDQSYEGSSTRANQSIKMESENRVENKNFCRFCEMELNSLIEAVEIPKNTEDFIKWLKIFGTKFSENVLVNSKPHFICMSHVFEKNWENC